MADPREALYGKADFLEMYARRKAAEGDKAMQNELAPYEHRAMAREVVAEEPWKAVSHALTIPLYQGAKLLKRTNSRSDPGLDQVIEGYRGIGEGLDLASAPIGKELAARLRALSGN